MAAIRTLFLACMGILSTGTVATSGLYIQSREYVLDQLGDDVIPKTLSEEVWRKLKENLSSKIGLKDPFLIQMQKETSKDIDGVELKNWCFSAYERNFNHIFKKKDQGLLDDVKSVCVLTIKEKLGQNALKDKGDEEKSIYKERLSTLKSYSEPQEGPRLNEDLKNIQSKVTDGEEDWKELQKWCEKEYKKGYQGERTGRWIYVNKFCNKSKQ